MQSVNWPKMVCVVNSLWKPHQQKTWCVEQINTKQSNQAGDKIIQTKINSKRLKGRMRTQESVYPVRSNDDLLWGREQLSVPLWYEFLYKEILSYKNQSSNLILPKSQSFPVTKRLNPNSVLFKVNQNNPNPSVCCQEKFSINPSLYVGF